MRVAALRRRGWTERAAIEADNLAEAEIRYLWADQSAAAPPPDVPRPTIGVRTAVRPAATGPALGLFDYPGKT